MVILSQAGLAEEELEHLWLLSDTDEYVRGWTQGHHGDFS